MKHQCRGKFLCICSSSKIEPNEDCEIHGLGANPRRCCICGKFIKRKIELIYDKKEGCLVKAGEKICPPIMTV